MIRCGFASFCCRAPRVFSRSGSVVPGGQSTLAYWETRCCVRRTPCSPTCKARSSKMRARPIRKSCGAVIWTSTTVPPSTHRSPMVCRSRAPCLPDSMSPALVIPHSGRPRSEHPRVSCARLVVPAVACHFANSLPNLAPARQTVPARHAQSRRAGPSVDGLAPRASDQRVQLNRRKKAPCGCLFSSLAPASHQAERSLKIAFN